MTATPTFANCQGQPLSDRPMSIHCLNDQLSEVQKEQNWKPETLENVKSSYIPKGVQRRESLSLKPMLEWSNSMEKVCQLQIGTFRNGTPDVLQTITAPYDYLISRPGKGIRKQLLAACNFWLKIDDASLTTIGGSISMLHNASLL